MNVLHCSHWGCQHFNWVAQVRGFVVLYYRRTVDLKDDRNASIPMLYGGNMAGKMQLGNYLNGNVMHHNHSIMHADFQNTELSLLRSMSATQLPYIQAVVLYVSESDFHIHHTQRLMSMKSVNEHVASMWQFYHWCISYLDVNSYAWWITEKWLGDVTMECLPWPLRYLPWNNW